MTGPRDSKDTSYNESDDGNHHTWYDGDRNSRISWDTNDDGDYVDGSGHTVDQSTGKTYDWD